MSFTPQRKPRKRLKQIILILIGVYVMIAASLYFIQEKILFLPTTLSQDYKFQFHHKFEELFLTTEDGASINALHFKADNPKGVILYFHGNAGDLSRWGEVVTYFVDLSYDVLVMDYRTYGKSKGKLSEKALYGDAQMCYDYLLEYYPKEDIILYGRSLGTGIASYIAANNNANQLILETPYYSITDVAKSRFPFLPVDKLLKYKIPTHVYLKDVECDITIIHGTEDNVVPYRSAEKLLTLDIDHINFITVAGGSHNNLIEFETYRKAIQNCLD